jgi:hypothetical protein
MYGRQIFYQHVGYKGGGSTRGPTPLAQKILKFEGSFGEILSIFPLSK